MTFSDKTVSINLMTMLLSFPECPQVVESMHDPIGEDSGAVDTFCRGIASLYVAGIGVLHGRKQNVYFQVSIGKPFWNSSIFLVHCSLRISGPQETVSLSTPSDRDKAFLLSSSTEPRSRLAHTSECVNHRDEHQTWLCHHKAPGTLPGLPLWLLSSEAGVALHLLHGLAQQLSLCPVLWSLSQFPFSLYAC